MKLKEYAAKEGIDYLTAWRRLKKGYLVAKKTSDGTYVITGMAKSIQQKGAPQRWTREKVVKEIYQFCKDEYVTTKNMPSFLYKLAIQFCGSIRQAKWEAGIIRDLRANKYKSRKAIENTKFRREYLVWVRNYCKGTYRKASYWPGYMRQMAHRYYGSIRAAKHAAGVLKDQRKHKNTIK